MFKQFMQGFEVLALDTFQMPLADYGFLCTICTSSELGCKMVFVNAERYVQISASVHPLDRPYVFVVALGEGAVTFPASDWNSIALWTLRNSIEGSEAGGNYNLTPPRLLLVQLDKAKNELLLYGKDFLEGDLGLFREVRAEQNCARQPYQVYTPDESGAYSASDEPISALMKEKYSTP